MRTFNTPEVQGEFKGSDDESYSGKKDRTCTLTSSTPPRERCGPDQREHEEMIHSSDWDNGSKLRGCDIKINTDSLK